MLFECFMILFKHSPYLPTQSHFPSIQCDDSELGEYIYFYVDQK